MKAVKHIHLIAVALALVLMLLPWSVNYIYSEVGDSGTMHEISEQFAYYDMEPVSNGYVYPMVTFVLTAMLVAVLALSYLSYNQRLFAVVSLALSCGATLVSFVPLILHGAEGMTVPGMTVSFLLICSIVMSVQRYSNRYFQNFEDDDE